MEALEEKYKGKPRIAFHKLDDEGERKFIQLKRDRVWTTVGWSFMGNFVGLLAVSWSSSLGRRWQGPKHKAKRDVLQASIFLGTVLLFTYYGYEIGRAHV